MSTAENHARLDDMGAGTPAAWEGHQNGAERPPSAPPVEAQAAMVLSALDRVEESLGRLTDQLAEEFATVLARQRVQEAQMAEFQAMLQEFRPLLEAAQRRLGGQSWRSRFNTGGTQG